METEELHKSEDSNQLCHSSIMIIYMAETSSVLYMKSFEYQKFHENHMTVKLWI
jgi:hypothetical protein